jgi:hypothetical protein
MPKIGRMSLVDQKFIKENMHKMTVKELAEKLDRFENQVEKEVLKFKPSEKVQQQLKQIEKDVLGHQKLLSQSLERLALAKEFDPAECDYFDYRFSRIMGQFGDDVLPTEETQIFLLIKYELLIHRNLAASKGIIDSISRLEKVVGGIYSKYRPDEEMDKEDKRDALNIENQLLTLRSAQQSKSNEFTLLQKEHARILKDLKATREQRITRIENSKQSILGLIKAIQEESFRKTEGEELQIAKAGAEKILKDFADYHIYADGEADRPILNHSTAGES